MQSNKWMAQIPQLGMEFPTGEEACQFWKKYSRKMGFNV